MERWDIYDKNKVRTGRTMERNHFNLADDEYHLTVLGVIRRPDGRFLITKRVMTKAWAPGWWEVSGGAAQAGEESEEAVRREVLEETGLDVKEAEGGYVFTYHRENPGEGDNYFVDVYRYTLDVTEQDVHLQTEETDGCRFATPEEIRKLADQGIFLHYDSIKRVFEVPGRRCTVMFAVLKREFRSYFQNVIGWLFVAALMETFQNLRFHTDCC